MIVWLASYPRSGNTYFRILLHSLYGIQTPSVYGDPIFESRKNVAEIVGHERLTDSIDCLARSEAVHLVKTHELPSDTLPAIYLVRDGRDALVSYVQYIGSYEASLVSGRDLLRELIVQRSWFGGWGPHVLAWARRPQATSVVVKFESLLEDPHGVAAAALEQVGLRPAASRDGQALPSFAELHELLPDFFRRGKVGSWRDEMPIDLEDLFWNEYGEAMTAVGYSR